MTSNWEWQKDCRTVGDIVAYSNPGTGETVILIINQATYIPSLEVNLLNLIQLRLSGVKVSEEAKFLAEKPDEHTYALKVPDENELNRFLIPLSLHDVIFVFFKFKTN